MTERAKRLDLVTDSYEYANRVSFYSYEVAGMKAALDYIAGIDAALSANNGMCFVSSGEFVISADGSTVCTIWWDPESECWRAQERREATS